MNKRTRFGVRSHASPCEPYFRRAVLRPELQVDCHDCDEGTPSMGAPSSQLGHSAGCGWRRGMRGRDPARTIAVGGMRWRVVDACLNAVWGAEFDWFFVGEVGGLGVGHDVDASEFIGLVDAQTHGDVEDLGDYPSDGEGVGEHGCGGD